ncbi:MAG: hypothetical protein WKG01_01965 [Kofleriaceae bacterium]
MKGQLLAGLTATTLLTTAVGSSGCGYILHPERRGNTGTIDGTTLILDLLWLLPGILPGVVFLIVDFSSGAMYRGAGLMVRPDGHLSVRLPASSEPTQVELRLVTGTQRVVARSATVVGPSIETRSVELQFRDALAQQTEPLYLEVATANGVSRFPSPISVAP